MPDWKPEIRRRLANLKLDPAREAVIFIGRRRIAGLLDSGAPRDEG